MSFARLHKLVTYLIAGLGLAALSLGDGLSGGVKILAFVAFVASAFVEGPLLRDPRWTRGWTVGLMALFVIQLARGLMGTPALPLLLEIVAALQISRLMNRRSAREHQQIAALALVHLIAATVLSTELAYALAFLGFVIALPWMLAMSHLRTEIETQLSRREDSLPRVLGSKRLIGPGFLAGTAALAIPLFALTGLLFVAFPRVGVGVLSSGQSGGRRTSGFGANVELGDVGVIRSDPTVVLRVTPPDLPSNPPAARTLRMRGTSFDHYDGRRWTRSRDLGTRSVPRVGDRYPVPERLPVPGRDRAWTVVLDALDEPVVFLPPGAVAIEVAPRVVGGARIGRNILHTPGVDVRYGDASGLGLRYVAWTSDERPPAEKLDAELARRYLQVPEGHERVAELARRWTAGATSDEERVRMLLTQLRDGGTHRYSLEMPRVGESVPLEAFLFEAKRGHCEYFASALAIQLRTLGIPARNVVGFLGGRFNRYGGYYALAQGDAHSWVEAFLPGRGWITLDPTPPSREAMASPLGGLRELVDALRIRWAADVVGYDYQRQAGVFRGIRRWLRGSDRREPSAPRVAAAPAEADGAPAWSWGAAALFAAVALIVARVRWRRRPSTAPKARDAVRLYRALDAALARAGHPRPAERTPLEHAAAVEQAGFPHSALVRDITSRYLEARYGGRGLEADELRRLLGALRAIRRKPRARS